MAVRVEVDGLAEQDGGVAMLPKDGPKRLGDLARGERAGRDLVQQRLEGVVVAAVDEGQIDPLVVPEALRGVQAAETATHDRDPVACWGARLHEPIVYRTFVGAPGSQVWTLARLVS